MARIDKTPLVVLCIYSLMKSFKINNRMLYHTAIKNEILLKCEDDGFKIASENPRPEIVQPRFIFTVPELKE